MTTRKVEVRRVLNDARTLGVKPVPDDPCELLVAQRRRIWISVDARHAHNGSMEASGEAEACQQRTSRVSERRGKGDRGQVEGAVTVLMCALKHLNLS